MKRAVAALLGTAIMVLECAVPTSAQVHAAAPQRTSTPLGASVYNLKLPGDKEATVYASGVAEIRSTKNRRQIEYRLLPGAFNRYAKQPQYLTDRNTMAALLAQPELPPYAAGRVLVVFKNSVGVMQDTYNVPARTLTAMRKKNTAKSAAVVPQYTSDYTVNHVFAKLGVDGFTRIGRSVSRSKLQSMRFTAAAQHPGAASGLDIANAYRVHLTGATVVNAVRALRDVPGVAYVTPDFTVHTMNAPAMPIPEAAQKAARTPTRMAMGVPSYQTPGNYAVSASGQPFLNATGVDAIAAYDEISRRFGQLPGQGVRITNVSLGDLDDAGIAGDQTDPCQGWVIRFGPTTRIVNGQRYLDMPSMPLIPTYTAAADGTLDGTGEVCGVDPILEEVGLDFSVMAPLPHDRQRGEAMGSGFSDLLGVAPGASYRLVVPKSSQPAMSDILAAFLAAANQTPGPDVITASIGFGMDAYGFPGRYFEDDPLISSAISDIVNSQNIVVVISANDGLRTYTNASVGPSGGSAATNLVTDPAQTTTIGDVAMSTVPSADLDSGAIDVGSTTLDDITAVNPLDPANANQTNARAVPETRFTGMASFSSGFGSRVNLSAPGDNIVALVRDPMHGGAAPVLSGGTSASAPEVAAAAAVAIQVARLTGHPFSKATDVRALLESTANPVVQAPQADQTLNVGPQVDVARAVEKLLGTTGMPQHPGVPRVAIMHRRGGNWNLNFGTLDTLFTEDTDRTNIDLQGPYDPYTQMNSGENAESFITIAPDWEALPQGTKFALTVTGKDAVLSTQSSARLLPAQILSAAGMTLTSPTQRTVSLTYRAYQGLHTVVSTSFQLTFGPYNGASELVHAPVVSPVVTGSVMTVNYDFSNFPTGQLSSPTLLVSLPGRINSATGNMYFVSYTMPLPPNTPKGSVTVPINALQGDGLYGVQLIVNRYTGLMSDYAPVRVATAGNVRAAAPVFVTQDPGTGTQLKSHYLEMPYGGSFTMSYDVSNVPNATGALLEISAPGTNLWGNDNPFNNPNGSLMDYNREDSGSVYQKVLYGTKGQLTIKASDANLVAGMNHVVRVIPMNGTQPAGEASDVSYLAEDGIVPSDGGILYDGYGINPQGKDGLLTSFQWTADGSVLKSVESFDQDTLATGNTIASSTEGCDAYFTAPNAIFGGDTALIQDWDAWGGCRKLYPITYSSVQDVASATTMGGAITPPLSTPTSIIFSTSSISGAPTGKGAFFSERWDMAYGSNEWSAQTFLGDVKSNNFDTPIDLDALGLVYNPIYRAMDYDSSTNLGYIVADTMGWMGWSGTTSIITADYGAGTATSFSVPGCGDSGDFELDPSTHTGILTEDPAGCSPSSELQMVNLTGKYAMSVGLPSVVAYSYPTLVSADPVNHLFFAEVPLSGDVSFNNNSLSSVVELDETGHVRSEMESFNFAYTQMSNHFFQVNPALRRGFVFGPNFMQIQPFAY